MSLSKLERETIINFNEAESEAYIYTYNIKLQHKLEKIMRERPDDVKITCVYGDGAKNYLVPKKFVSVRPTRILSSEQREKMAQVAKERFCDTGVKE